MSGAAYFAAKAAYRTGAGLVEILCPEENRVIYQTQLPEALLTLYDPHAPDKNKIRDAIDRADAIAIGMGLGTEPLTQMLLEITLNRAKVPLLLDADALNTLAEARELYPLLLAYPSPKVITPHLGEAARLLSTPIMKISADLPTYAELLHRRTDAIAVLKDARTVICDGTHTSLNTFGSSGMATGGSGDVLAGIITALLASTPSPYLAAELGVLIHALAGDAAAAKCGTRATMASDILDGLCEVL
jgi:NAD(P)H-hydrate epimerase